MVIVYTRFIVSTSHDNFFFSEYFSLNVAIANFQGCFVQLQRKRLRVPGAVWFRRQQGITKRQPNQQPLLKLKANWRLIYRVLNRKFWFGPKNINQSKTYQNVSRKFRFFFFFFAAANSHGKINWKWIITSFWLWQMGNNTSSYNSISHKSLQLHDCCDNSWMYCDDLERQTGS